MVEYLKIEIDGTIIQDKILNINDLYKKCGYRKNINFNILTSWKDNDDEIQIWGKKVGKTSHKNKYDFNLNITVYGNCAVIRINNKSLKDICSLNHPIISWLNKTDNNVNNQPVIDNVNTTFESVESVESTSSDTDGSFYEADDEFNIDNFELKEEDYVYSSE